jgi:hypothetical protein
MVFEAVKNMQFSLLDLIKAGLAQIQEVIIQIERNAQLNDVMTIFLVNDVLTIVS